MWYWLWSYPITMSNIKEIAQAFNGTALEPTEALKKALCSASGLSLEQLDESFQEPDRQSVQLPFRTHREWRY